MAGEHEQILKLCRGIIKPRELWMCEYEFDFENYRYDLQTEARVPNCEQAI